MKYHQLLLYLQNEHPEKIHIITVQHFRVNKHWTCIIYCAKCLVVFQISKQFLYMFPSLEHYSGLNRLILPIVLTNNMLTKHANNRGSSMIISVITEDWPPVYRERVLPVSRCWVTGSAEWMFASSHTGHNKHKDTHTISVHLSSL